ncbi:hypothetical protein PBI_OMNICRON_70 [Mycobacterium phage Omnicron]|uniref:Helix-turn-helix DNA binding domain protein n=1 Tax=Mycobacterium phage Omnicron TaxID=1541819 RepID=A0A088FQH7_9CAUD|nr:hypothetical protein PBI_OMNICRON_70 [Mycobacterium phage Omnicron]AIM50403.1 hypothetical protein PBI_OMNICRON_70 [Mycobacterium phage Omnicron]
MADGTCGHCGHAGMPAGLAICWDCAKLLRKYLAEVPWYVARLRETAYGEAKTGRPGLRVSTGEKLPSPKLNERAAGLLRDANIRLGEMVRQVIADEKWDASNSARALQSEIGRLMVYPYAADAITWAIGWRQDAERVIDLPPDLKYAGPCQAMRYDEYREANGEPVRQGQRSRCNAALYVDERDQTATCPRCGTLWTVEMLQRKALTRVDESPKSAADMWRLLKLCGRDVPRSSFYRLMQRVEAHSVVDGTPMYTYSSVVAALDEQERAALSRGNRKRAKGKQPSTVDHSTRDAVSC